MRRVLVLCLLCGWPVLAHAGNQDGIALGNDASMSGMAVTANADDASAAWYNPAGLAAVDRTDVTVAGSAYALRIQRVRAGYRAQFADRRTNRNLRSRSFDAVPAAFVFARALNDHITGTLGFFVPRQQSSSYSESLRDLPGRVDALGGRWVSQQRFELAFDAVQYMVGPAIGARLPHGVSIGGALYLANTLERRNLRVWNRSLQVESQPDGPQGGALFEELRQRDNRRIWGVQGVVGVQYRHKKRYRLGLTVRTPTLQLVSRSDVGVEEFSTLSYDGVPVQDRLSFPEGSDGRRVDPRQVTPLRVHAGMARYFENVWLSAEASFQPSLGQGAPPAYSDPVWNARFGAMFRVSPWVGVGAGVFTDNSGSQVRLFTPDVNYYGATFGVRVRSRATPRRPGAARETDVRNRLSIATVLSCRYSLGWGKAPVVILDHDGAPGAAGQGIPAQFVPVRTEAAAVRWHELSLYLGSLIKF